MRKTNTTFRQITKTASLTATGLTMGIGLIVFIITPTTTYAADSTCHEITGQSQPVVYGQYANSGQLKFDSPYRPAAEHRACERDTSKTTLRLEGWVWNTNMGWISLYCGTDGFNQGIACGDYTYGVTVNKDTGEFRGYAWNDNTGYISFSCEDDNGGCTIDNTHQVKAETDPDCTGTIYSTSTYATPPNCPAHTAADSFAWSDTVGWIDMSGVTIPWPPRAMSVDSNAGPTGGGNTIEIKGDFFAEPVYYQSVNITNTQGELTDYQTNFTLNTSSLISAGKMRSDCGDLEIYNTDGKTPLPYHINPETCGTANTQIWVKTNLPASSSKTIYASYNGTTKTQYPEHVFYFYENFEKNLYQWQQVKTSSTSTIQLTDIDSYEGAQSVEVYQTVDNGDTYLYAQPTFSGNSILELAFYDKNTTSTHVMGDPDFYAGTFGANNNYYYHDSAGWHDTGIARSLGWKNLKLVFTGSNAQVYINNTHGGTSVLATALDQINIMQHLVGAAGYYTDFIRLRQYVASEPGTSLGTETSTSTSVEFGANASSSVTYIDSQTLEVVVPASTTGTGTVNVTIINPDTQESVLYNAYTYNPAPTVTLVTPNEGTVGGGTPVEITGTNFYALYTTPVTLTNTGAALSEHQVSFTLDTAARITAGKMRSDCGNLRVKNTDQLTDIPYWIEDGTCNTATTKIWTRAPKIAANGNTIIYAVYGNPIQTGNENGNNVFEFFDNFSGTSVDTTKWEGDTGQFGVSGGILQNTSTTNHRLQSINDFNNPAILEIKHLTATGGTPTNGYQVGGFYGNDTNSIGYLQNATTDYYRLNNSYVSLTSDLLPENTQMLVRYAANGTSVDMSALNYTTGTSLHSATVTNSIDKEKIALGKKYDDSTNTESYNGNWDWIYVRKYTASQPATAIGVETITTPTITFDTQEATSVSWINSTSLTTATPAHSSGSVNVSVTNPDNQTGTLNNGYTYINITDPATSSFTATPTGVMADGISTSLLTATLRDSLSAPVAGATVTIGVTGATVRAVNCTSADVGTVTKGRTNSNGQACFLATSATMAENLEFTATDTTNSIEITEKATVSFTNCIINPTTSTFAASKAQVQTDGLDSANLNLHLKDYCGFNVDKTNIITLDDNSATSVTYTPPGLTAPQTYSTTGGGLLTTAISSLTSGIFTFDAGLNEKQYDITSYIENPGIPNEYNGSGTIIAGSSNQDNTQVSFNMPFNFSLYDQTVTAGNPVYICTNGFLSLNSGDCPTNGALTNAIAGYHMDLTTNGGGIYQRTTANSITFVFDAQTKSAEDVNFEIKLFNNNRIEIHYENAVTAATPFIGLYNNSSVANASSLTTPRTNKATKFTYNTPVTAFDLDDHPQVEFLAGAVNVNNSTVVADPFAVTADGNSYSIITVTVRDVNMNPIPGRDIQVDQNGTAQVTQFDCGDLTTPAPAAPTDSNGKACYRATNTIAQLVTFTATDITDLPIILGSDTVDFGCVTGPGQQCLQVTLEAGEGSITMTAPSNFSFLPVNSGMFAQEQFTCDDATLCPNNLTGYNLNIDDLLTITDTRNQGGFTVQLQASTPFEKADNTFLPFQNFYASTTPATTGGTKIGGIEYDTNYSGPTCAGTPLNTNDSLLNAGSFFYNFGTGNTIPSTIHDLMQCEVTQGQGRNAIIKQNVNYHLLLPALQSPGLYQVTLTYDLII